MDDAPFKKGCIRCSKGRPTASIVLTKHDFFEKPALPHAAGSSSLMDRFPIRPQARG
jgi:hypothetical protein